MTEGTGQCHITDPDKPGMFPKLISDSLSLSVPSGKYLVSPLSRLLDDGLYAASVSIRSGRGSASTDRVMRFTATFPTQEAAGRYALKQGLAWVRVSGGGRAGRTGWKALMARLFNLVMGRRLAHG